MKAASTRKRVLLTVILMAALRVVVFAENADYDPEVLPDNAGVNLEKIIVTPYRVGVSGRENPSATSVINVSNEEAFGKFGFVDAIKGSQGIDYTVTGGMEGVSSVYIRGADAYHTQLMLDGIRVYDPTNTQGYFAYYNYLSLDNLDKVEVSRGPFSSLYGSQSIGGSINMITHKGSGKPTFSFLQELGS